MKKHKKLMKESFEGNIKLVPLIPLSELAFHGGNPTPEDVGVLADDFDEEFDEAENALDKVLLGIVDNAKEADFSDVSTQIAGQVSLLRKAVGAFRANVQKIYDAKKKKLGGR